MQVPLTYQASPIDNPLKGLVPFVNQSAATGATFPHSLQWAYIPLSAVMTGPNTFDWTQVEGALKNAAADGSQLILRFYLDYPGTSMPKGIPQWLLNGGLTVYPYPDNGGGTAPNYEDPTLQKALTTFISNLGARYDPDSRLAFIQAGLLGWWGEWHNGGTVTAHYASLTTQQLVLNAYQSAFKTKKLMVRYAAGTNNTAYGAAPCFRNDNLPFGYHDDAFCFYTVGTPLWYMVPQQQAAGPGAVNKWQTCPFGGEIYPDYGTTVWNTPSGAPAGQDFATCAKATHASWLGDWKLFTPGAVTGTALASAKAGAQLLGYEFFVASYETLNNASRTQTTADVTLKNTGIAPFYYDNTTWPIQLAAFSGGKIVETWSTPWSLTGILPGASVQLPAVPLPNRPTGSFTLLMRAVNPMTGGRQLRFANTTQDQTVAGAGWLTLGVVPAL